VRFHFDPAKSERLRKNQKRGIGFEEVQEIFLRPYYLEVRNDLPLQTHRDWMGGAQAVLVDL
jgi:uncharacterized DUF497 family protein